MLKEREIQEFLEEIGKLGSVLGLDSMRELLEELGNVHDQLPMIHVAGTNGKGSLCAMVSSILKEAGYRVGAYTSPAVFDQKEQYQVNGEAISQEEYIEIFTAVKEAWDRVKERGKVVPTLYEVETAAAFLYFYRKECEIVLLETGMGGATDATNIIRKPFVSVLTSISMDHMNFLGNSLEEIARVKAGIIKEYGSVVAIKPKQKEVQQVIEDTCREKHASLSYAKGEDAVGIHWEQECLSFSYGQYGEIRLSMTGAYQVENSICAIEVVEALKKLGWSISPSHVKQGLEKAKWEGRFSVLCQEPLFIIDGAHNEDAVKKLRETLKMGFTNGKIIYIIGVLVDKEYEKMLKEMLPLAWKVFVVTPEHNRALDARILAQKARQYHWDVTCCETVSEAVAAAGACAKEEGAMVLAFGSLSYLGELRKAALCMEEARRFYDR